MTKRFKFRALVEVTFEIPDYSMPGVGKYADRPPEQQLDDFCKKMQYRDEHCNLRYIIKEFIRED